MYRNKPPAIAWQLDRCDVCGDKYHRSDLVRTQVEFLEKKAENFLNYSSYEGTYWVVDDAADEGNVSYGNRCDNVRLSLDGDNDLSYVNGVQTWSGNGTMRTETISPKFSTSSRVTFSVQVGPHEQNSSPSMTVILGICNSDGTSKQAIRTLTTSGTSRAWFTESAVTLDGYGISGSQRKFYWYVQVANAGKWWIDEMQIESSTATGEPENFVRTSGSLVSNQSDQQLIPNRKVCSGCRERILSKSERFGRTDESPIDEPVETWAQEI